MVVWGDKMYTFVKINFEHFGGVTCRLGHCLAPGSSSVTLWVSGLCLQGMKGYYSKNKREGGACGKTRLD